MFLHFLILLDFVPCNPVFMKLGLVFRLILKDDLRYTTSDCFETFPFLKDFESNPALESAGKEYYEFRAALMVRNNEG